MVTISNGTTTSNVTIGAYNTIYKAKGFYIVSGANKIPVVKNEGNKVEVTKDEKEPTTKIAEPIETPKEESDWVTELLEKPISQWSKEETASFAKEKNIDTSYARKLSEAKEIIKEWLDEQSR